MCKPDPRIFSNILKRYGLKAEETLLLDDSDANCQSAGNLGIKTITVKKTGPDTMLGIGERLLEEGPAL